MQASSWTRTSISRRQWAGRRRGWEAACSLAGPRARVCWFERAARRIQIRASRPVLGCGFPLRIGILSTGVARSATPSEARTLARVLLRSRARQASLAVFDPSMLCMQSADVANVSRAEAFEKHQWPQCINETNHRRRRNQWQQLTPMPEWLCNLSRQNTRIPRPNHILQEK